MKISIVEDETKLAEVLEAYLMREGFTTERFDNGKQALQSLVDDPPDLVLLDLMLPGLDGMSVCRELRKSHAVPIIMITARIEEIDRLLGLEIGADDYVCKPFSPREVVARVKAVLRRSVSDNAHTNDGSFSFCPETATVSIHGHDVSLTLVELELLKALHERPGHIFSRAKLMHRIYPDNRIVSDRTIDSHVKKLRQKLRSVSGDEEYVHSVYGIGYKFDMPQPDGANLSDSSDSSD